MIRYGGVALQGDAVAGRPARHGAATVECACPRSMRLSRACRPARFTLPDVGPGSMDADGLVPVSRGRLSRAPRGYQQSVPDPDTDLTPVWVMLSVPHRVCLASLVAWMSWGTACTVKAVADAPPAREMM